MDMQFGNLEQLNWLWVVAAIGTIVTVALLRYRRNLNRFASPKLLGNLLPKGTATRTIATTVLSLAAMALLSLSLSTFGGVKRLVKSRKRASKSCLL